MKPSRTIPYLVTITLALCLAATVASAQDRDRSRDRDLQQDKVRVRDQVRQDTGLSDQEWGKVDSEVEGYLQDGGHGGEVSQLVRDSHAAGCRGECLAEAVRTMNRARAQGMSEGQAREMVTSEIRAQARERQEGGKGWSDDEMGRKLRDRMENRFSHRERETEREMERERETEQHKSRSGSERESHGGKSGGGGEGRGGSRGGGGGGGRSR